ncbi:hypothetical protein C4G53_RS12785 [Vibrio parahaemolyticus]|nr:hypothetical protein [Vibrio parahaemolyticus]
MKELNYVVSAHLNQMCTDGSLEKMIQEQAEKLVSELLKESMRSYGSFGKAIQKKLDESLQNSLNDVTLPEFNRFIGEALIQSYEHALNVHAVDKVKELVNGSLHPVKAELTAQEFLDGIKDAARHWDLSTEELILEWDTHGDSSTITLIIERNTRITLYDHKSSNEHHIGYLSNDNYVFSGPLFDSTHCFGIDAYLYKLYCSRTQIKDLMSVYGENIWIGEEY